jgi:WD40 repeat protein
VLNDEPVPPSRLQARLPVPLEVICMKCLAKDPARRYASAGALADDLERFLAGEPILAQPVSSAMRLLLWARRRPGPAALLTAGVLMGLGVLIGLFWFARHEQRRRLEAVALQQQADSARETAAKAETEARRTEEKESAAKGLAETQRQAAIRARRESLRKLAELFVERGRDLCENGDIRLGVVWMARGGAYASEEPDLGRICGLNVAGWLRRFTPSLRVVLQHDHVHVAAFSPDGQRVATGHKAYDDNDRAKIGSLAIHDTVSGKRLHLLELKQAAAALAWSKDGGLVAVGTGNGNRENWGKGGTGAVQVVSAGDGQPRGKPLPHPHTVRSLAFHPGGKVLLSGCQDGSARLWSLETGAVVKELKLGAPVVVVGFQPNGKHFITVANKKGEDGKTTGHVQVWEGSLEEPKPGPAFFTTHPANTGELTPDGRAVLVGEYWLGVWSADPAAGEFGKPIGKPVGDGRWAVAVSADASLMATCGNNWQARVFQTARGQQLGQTLLLHGWSYCVAFSPDGKTLLTGDNDNASLWDLALPAPPAARLRTERVHTLAFSPDRTRLAAALDGNRVQLFDARTGQPLGPAQGLPHPQGTPRLALGSDNKTLATACYDGSVRVWDAERGQLLHARPWKHDATVNVVALSADSRLVVSGARDGKAQVWDVKSGQAVGPVLPCGAEVTAAAFSPDGQRVVLGDLSFQVRCWRVGDGQPLGKPVPLTGQPTALAVSRDGRRVLVGTSGDNVARLVDVETGQPIGPLLQHKDAVLDVAFSPNELLLATGSGSRDGTARLWDAATGKALGPPVRHRGNVSAVGFSDGAFLWTAGTDRQVVRTELPSLPAGSAERVYWETVLRAGMLLDDQNVEHALGYHYWLKAQEWRDQADRPKKP